MTHISPCPSCKTKIVYSRELTDEEKKDSNCVLYPELQMFNYCPRCSVFLFAYPLTLSMRYDSQLAGTKKPK